MERKRTSHLFQPWSFEDGCYASHSYLLMTTFFVQEQGWTDVGRYFVFQDKGLWIAGCLFLFKEVFFAWPLNILKT